MTEGSDLSAPLEAKPFFVDGTEFQVAPFGGFPNQQQLVIAKPLSAVKAYEQLLAAYDRPRMVEFGIAYGGSVGFHSLVARPTRLVAFELAEARVPLLDELIAERGLEETVRLHYGVDQGDRPHVEEIITGEFGGEPLDLVIDDASNFYRQTGVSFETLFPHLRPGGEYIIEDWNCDHRIRALMASALADPTSPQHGWARSVADGRGVSRNAGQSALTAVAAASLGFDDGAPDRPALRPLSRLAAELVHGVAEAGSGIASVSINEFWVSVTRSEVELDPASFSIAGACPDHFATLAG